MDTNTTPKTATRYCIDCEQDMSEQDYQERLAALDPWARWAGVLPSCDDCEDKRRDAWLENPYG